MAGITAGVLAFGLAGCMTDGGWTFPAVPSVAAQPGPPAPPPPGPPVGPPVLAGPPVEPPVPVSDKPPTTVTVQDPGDVNYFPSDEPMKLAVEHFNRGHYGLAQRYFQDAVEKAPRDPAAWIGLAASYDHLARFDLADRAYRSAIRLTGETTDLLNNLGYSYMLRGDYVAARRKFTQALRRDPGNPTVINNLKLLDDSVRYVERNPNVAPK